jgi:hypothetical protein
MPRRALSFRKEIPSALLFVGLTGVILAAVSAAVKDSPNAGENSGSASVTPARPSNPPHHVIKSKTSSRSALQAAHKTDDLNQPTGRAKSSRRGHFLPHFASLGVAPQRRDSVAPKNEASSKKNLITLATAMHDYHRKHGHFPPAVVLGPDGKTPHSWRVELLPYLDQKALYEQYRMGEPWDSKDNIKVLSQMPPVFHSPYDDPNSCNSGYFALVGTGTVFEGAKGIANAEITGGTNNTLLLAECRRQILWTKPEDISFDPYEALPELGGFLPGSMAGVMADGSYRLITLDRQAEEELRGLIIRNDKQPVT